MDTIEIEKFKTFPTVETIESMISSSKILIKGKTNFLMTEKSIIVPAHMPYFVTPNGCFKMFLTVIKNGNENNSAQKMHHI